MFSLNVIRGALPSLTSAGPICFSLANCGRAGAGQYVWVVEEPPSERASLTGDDVRGVRASLSIRAVERGGLSEAKIRAAGQEAH